MQNFLARVSALIFLLLSQLRFWLKALTFSLIMFCISAAQISGLALACFRLDYQISEPEALIERSNAIFLARAERAEMLPQEIWPISEEHGQPKTLDELLRDPRSIGPPRKIKYEFAILETIKGEEISETSLVVLDSFLNYEGGTFDNHESNDFWEKTGGGSQQQEIAWFIRDLIWVRLT